MVTGGTVVILFCSRLVSNTPKSIGLLLLCLVVGLWAIATLLIEALTSVSFLKSSTVASEESRFLQLASDASVTVVSPLTLGFDWFGDRLWADLCVCCCALLRLGWQRLLVGALSLPFHLCARLHHLLDDDVSAMETTTTH